MLKGEAAIVINTRAYWQGLRGGVGGGKSKILWELCWICAPWGCAGLQLCTCIQPRRENKDGLHVGELERTGAQYSEGGKASGL